MHDRTGCLSKVGMPCKHDTELMQKIWKLKGYCLLGGSGSDNAISKQH